MTLVRPSLGAPDLDFKENDMADNSLPPVPDRLAKWRSEGETVELMGRQIWYHDSGPVSYTHLTLPTMQ